MPGRETPDAAPAIVDSRMGIVRCISAVSLAPHLPQMLRLYAADLGDSNVFSSWPADRVSAGCCWWDQSDAQRAALGEAVERYCANLIPTGLRSASYDELLSCGECAIDPTTLALFSEEQHASPLFPFEPFATDLRVQWAEGRDLRHGDPCLVPASMVYASYSCRAQEFGIPHTNPIPYAGVAAGVAVERALSAAILEVLERDAVTLNWLSGAPIASIRTPEPFDALFAGPQGVLRTSLVDFPSEFGVPVIGALVRNDESGMLSLGTACRFDPWQAALKAVSEAMQLHLMLAQLDDPTSPLMRHAAASPGALHSWRADRAYRLSYAADLHDVSDLICQLQLFLDPALHPVFLERFQEPEVDLETVAQGGPRTTLEVLTRLVADGFRPVSVDITTSDLRPLGWCVVRVVVPGLYPNTPAAFPPLAGKRLRDVLSRRGRAPADVYLLPIPYA